MVTPQGMTLSLKGSWARVFQKCATSYLERERSVTHPGSRHGLEDRLRAGLGVVVGEEDFHTSTTNTVWRL
jgi:hypothetical protein